MHRWLSSRRVLFTSTDDAPGSPQLVSLAGTGIVPAVTLAPTNLAFGDQRLSTTSPVQTVTLTNRDRKSTRLNSSHRCSSYAVFFAKTKSGVAPCPLAGGPVAAS